METIIRYANGTLYSQLEKRFINSDGIAFRTLGEYRVIDRRTKKDITDEVAFLAEVELVKKNNAYKRVRIVYETDKA